jgi:hypothetical protein
MKGNPKGWSSSEPAFENFFQDDKTDSPQDDQRGNGEINEDFVLKTHEAIGEQGEPGIAERRYGMEEGKIESGHQGKVVTPSYKEEEGPDEFNNDSVEKNGFQKPIDVPYGKLGEGVLNDSLIPKTDGPPEEEVKEDGKGHNPQSPYLNEDQNNHLSKLRIEASRIHHNQPGHAYRRGCRKEGIDERG